VGYALAVLIYELGQSEGALAGKIVGRCSTWPCSAP
jgi:hypothetical protein